MMLFKAALGLSFFAAGVWADDKRDLGSVLAGNKDLSKFYDLIKVDFSVSRAICRDMAGYEPSLTIWSM